MQVSAMEAPLDI